MKIPERWKEPLSIKRSRVGFGYAAEVRVYPNQGSDIPELAEIPHAALKYKKEEVELNE